MMDRSNESPALEERMKIRFDVDELNGFYRKLEPLDLDALWAVLDGEEQDER